MTMTPSRPYLIRALYEWIVENECTPYILVNALAEGVEVPQEYVKDGQITLNISVTAAHNLSLRNEAIDFDGRFAGIPRRVFVPVDAVIGIIAKENGQGMIFDADTQLPNPPGPTGSDDPGSATHRGERQSAAGKKPPLRLVK